MTIFFHGERKETHIKTRHLLHPVCKEPTVPECHWPRDHGTCFTCFFSWDSWTSIPRWPGSAEAPSAVTSVEGAVRLVTGPWPSSFKGCGFVIGWQQIATICGAAQGFGTAVTAMGTKNHHLRPCYSRQRPAIPSCGVFFFFFSRLKFIHLAGWNLI